MRHDHPENYLISRVGSLRAAVLNANDGITSTASLVMGVASAASNSDDALNAGAAACADRTGIGCHVLGKYCCTLMLLVLSPTALLLPVVSAGSSIFLALQGMIGAKVNGAEMIKPRSRVTLWGTLPVTTGIGAVFGKIL